MQNLKVKHYSVHELIWTTNEPKKSISLELSSYGKSMFGLSFFQKTYTSSWQKLTLHYGFHEIQQIFL